MKKTKAIAKAFERGDVPAMRTTIEAKTLNKFGTGNAPANHKEKQFLLNDRKVLRFKAYWDDTTLYGARIYFTIHCFLADNTIEINEAHVRNSGRDSYPVFFKRGPLLKRNVATVYPGMLKPDPEPYAPQDLLVGSSIMVWGRKVIIYDCDQFTRKFYHSFMGIDQSESTLDVSEPPLFHAKLAPPPHQAPGTEEDSLINCVMVRPKPPKQDLVRLMTLTGEILRFESKFVNAVPEDAVRRFVVCFYPSDDTVGVFELQGRNSGFTGGKFRERCRAKNPLTGAYFKLQDFAVGLQVEIASQVFHMLRADEHTLAYMEQRPLEAPVSDPLACARRLGPLTTQPELQNDAGVDPDRLKELAYEAGVDLIDHEVITLLRSFGLQSEDSRPFISGPKALQAVGLIAGDAAAAAADAGGWIDGQ